MNKENKKQQNKENITLANSYLRATKLLVSDFPECESLIDFSLQKTEELLIPNDLKTSGLISIETRLKNLETVYRKSTFSTIKKNTAL